MILEIKSDYTNKCGDCKYFETENHIDGKCINLENKLRPWNRNRFYNSKACVRKEKLNEIELKEEYIKMNENNLLEKLEELSEISSLDEIQNTLDKLKKKNAKRKDLFKENELVVYISKDFDGNIYKVEIGKIKRLCDDGAFVWYHTGDTAAKTDYNDLYKIENGYAINNLGGQNNE